MRTFKKNIFPTSVALLISLIIVSFSLANSSGDKFRLLHRNSDSTSTSPISQIDRDYDLLQNASLGIDTFHDRFENIHNTMTLSELFPTEHEVELMNIWAAYLRHRKMLLTITHRYAKDRARVTKALTFGPTIRQKEILLGYSSSSSGGTSDK